MASLGWLGPVAPTRPSGTYLAGDINTPSVGGRGNTLRELFAQAGGLLTAPDDGLAELNILIRVASARLGMSPPVKRLTINQIKAPGKAPKFKGKASTARYMLKVVAYILENLVDRRDRHANLRYRCIKTLNDVYELLYAWRAGGPPCAAEVARLGRLHCNLYAELTAEAIAKLHAGQPLLDWRIYPKHHLFLHVVEDQLRFAGNPMDPLFPSCF